MTKPELFLLLFKKRRDNSASFSIFSCSHVRSGLRYIQSNVFMPQILLAILPTKAKLQGFSCSQVASWTSFGMKEIYYTYPPSPLLSSVRL